MAAWLLPRRRRADEADDGCVLAAPRVRRGRLRHDADRRRRPELGAHEAQPRQPRISRVRLALFALVPGPPAATRSPRRHGR